MAKQDDLDAVVVGSGPNGLAAAITLAAAGRSVRVIEADLSVGGGARSADLTLPGFVSDICSTSYPLAGSSPFFEHQPFEKHGLRWLHPAAPLAHPFDDGTAVVLERSIQATAQQLGPDERAYIRLMKPLAAHWNELAKQILGPLRPPRHPLVLARFGLEAMRSGRGLAEAWFKGERARALVAGLAAHSVLPLEQSPTAAFALVMGGAAHAVGWPFASGGAQRITDALVSLLRSMGGEIVTGTRIQAIEELPPARVVLFDVTPRQFLNIARDRLPRAYRRALEGFRYGPGVFKMDWALDAPIPWRAHECLRAGIVHVGGKLEEIAASERAAWEDKVAERPFVILAQPTLFDPSRAPAGKHVAWAYCHVPNGSTEDMTARIETQIERFAPGFRDRILARHVMPPAELERHNANYVGGDIGGGAMVLRQLFTRPSLQVNPYSTPLRGTFLCSASTPPGGGVHGMCGYYAAKAAFAL